VDGRGGLENRVVLVTGGGRNIGRAIALACADAGASVGVVVRTNVDEGQNVVDEVRARGVDAALAVGDIAVPGDDERIVRGIRDALGPVDVLVNSAAARPRAAFLDITIEDWDDVLRSNLSSIFYLARLVLPSMVERGFGRIITLGGPDAHTGYANRAHNVTCKAGLIGLTKSIAREFGPHGVTANVLVPGMTDTTRNPVDYPDWPPSDEVLRSQLCIPRLGQPEEVANACVFLSSDQAAYITGQTIHVSGGMVLP
jgi:3-oxoacyl-[acyl-carrier protein] reductase